MPEQHNTPLVTHLRKIMSIFMLFLVFGCLQLPGAEPAAEEAQHYANKLDALAAVSPKESITLISVNIKKLTNVKEFLKAMKIDYDLSLAAGQIDEIGMVELPDDRNVLVIKSSLLSMLEPMIGSVLGGQLGAEEDYKGFKLKSYSEKGYFKDSSSIYIGDIASLKGVVDVIKGADSARGKFMGVIEKLQDNDIMLVDAKPDPAKQTRATGMSVTIKGNIGNTYTVQEMESEELAKQMAGVTEANVGKTGAKPESIRVEGRFLYMKMDADITHIMQFNQAPAGQETGSLGDLGL